MGKIVVPVLGVLALSVTAGNRSLCRWFFSNQTHTTSSPSSSATVIIGPPDFNLTVSPTANVVIGQVLELEIHAQ